MVNFRFCCHGELDGRSSVADVTVACSDGRSFVADVTVACSDGSSSVADVTAACSTSFGQTTNISFKFRSHIDFL